MMYFSSKETLVPIIIWMVHLQACKLDRNIKCKVVQFRWEKVLNTKNIIFHFSFFYLHPSRWVPSNQFMKRHGWCYWMGTHTAQADPQEMREKALVFMHEVKGSFIGLEHDPWFIYNMDQMTISYLLTAKRTLTTVGSRMVNIQLETWTQSMLHVLNHAWVLLNFCLSLQSSKVTLDAI